MKRTICPRCGSSNIDWIIPQVWSRWVCKDCSYTGPAIEADDDLANEINSPWLKICLDTGHCTTQKVNPADAVRMIGKDMLRVLHIHDNDGTNDKHWVPYTGIIDWEDFKKALQDIEFDGCVSLETIPPIKFTGKIRMLQEKSLFYTARELAGMPF